MIYYDWYDKLRQELEQWENYVDYNCPPPEFNENSHPHQCIPSLRYNKVEINYSNVIVETFCYLKQKFLFLCPLLDNLPCPQVYTIKEN